MRIGMNGVIVAAAIVCASTTAHAAVQSKDQQKCINAMNKDGAKVSSTQAKLQAGCIKGMSTGKNTDAEACIIADENQKLATAAAKTTADDTDNCVGSPPDFGFAGAASVNAAATTQRRALLSAIFGSTLNTSVVLQDTNKDIASCQSKVLKSLDKLLSTKIKVFNSCKKSTLATAVDALALETPCFAAIVTSTESGNVAKAIQKASDARAKSCLDADLATAFPGDCSSFVGVAFDSCAEAAVECRACYTINEMDGLTMDCDMFDDGAANESCQPPASACIFVSSSLGTALGDGTAADPLDTIGNGILAAVLQDVSAVCVSGESYVEQIEMVSGVSLLGGYDHTAGFTFSELVTTTISNIGTVVLADGIDDVTTISDVTIQAQQSPVPGSSTYGVRLVSGAAQLTVSDSVINAAAGASGAPGGDGTTIAPPSATVGANGNAGCSNCGGAGAGGAAGVCTEFGGKGGNGGNNTQSGQSGSPGSGGATVGTGATSNGCFGATAPAGTGGSVSAGLQGSPGAAGGSLGAVAGGFYAPADGGNGDPGVNGGGGSGGGGGGGGEDGGGFCNADGGGGGGAGGCGGVGGNNGGGGGGGGGSFGVFVAAGSASVIDTTITTVGGGTGGTGGDGSAGQLGGGGGTGGPGADDSDPGGNGGPGAAGGAGGPGSGGGGGPSACIARSALASASSSGLSCITGVPGFGGSGGTNPQGGIGASGATGTAASSLQIN